MHHAKVAKARRQIMPADAHTVAVERRVDKQAVIARCRPKLALPAGQQVSDALAFIVSQSISCSITWNLLWRIQVLRNLIDDTL
jgi:hypothetical protein